MATTQVSPFSTPPQCPLTLHLLQHYLWAGGHFVLLISALRYFLATITLKAVSSWWYKGLSLRLDFIRQWLITLIVRTVSFTGALISYVIVCQSVFPPASSPTYSPVFQKVAWRECHEDVFEGMLTPSKLAATTKCRLVQTSSGR